MTSTKPGSAAAEPPVAGDAGPRSLRERQASGRPGDETRRRLAVGRQRRVWNLRASSWSHHVANNQGLSRVIDAVVATAREVAGTPLGDVVDLGSGSGQVTLAMADGARSVLAVDISAGMLDELADHARRQGLTTVDTRLSPIEQLSLPPASVDVVVSNYALHHLRDPDKAELLASARRWLRPGGHLVVGDMMLGRGGDAADRAVIATKVRQLARKGPGGWWRIAKNAARLLLRVQERPLSAAAWQRLAVRQGFVDVAVRPVVQEAAILVARVPDAVSPTGGDSPRPASEPPPTS